MTKLLQYTVWIAGMIALSGCFGGACNVVPDVNFRSENLSLSTHPQVFAPNGWTYLAGGVSGLIIYNTGDGLVAFDRCSTVDPDKRNPVRVDGLLIVDDQSGAKWLLRDGSPTHIAECSLRRYGVTKQGSLYYVYN